MYHNLLNSGSTHFKSIFKAIFNFVEEENKKQDERFEERAINRAEKPKAYYQSNSGSCTLARSTMGSGGINLSGASCAMGGNYNTYYKTVNKLRDQCMYQLGWKLIIVE